MDHQWFTSGPSRNHSETVATTRRVLPTRRQHPPLAPLGGRPLRPSSPTRPRTPPRDRHRRTRLVSRRVAMLAGPYPIRPRATPRAKTPHHRHHPHPFGPRARPRCHPADARRRRHPKGPSAKRLTASRHPLPTDVDTGRPWRRCDPRPRLWSGPEHAPRAFSATSPFHDWNVRPAKDRHADRQHGITPRPRATTLSERRLRLDTSPPLGKTSRRARPALSSSAWMDRSG